MLNLSKLKNSDPVLLILIVILTIIGALLVFGTTYFPDKEPSDLFYNQIIFYIVGFGIILLLGAFDYRELGNRHIVGGITFITILLLILVLFIGEEVLGTRRWINLGAFNLQPSELTKLTVVLLTSYILSLKFSDWENWIKAREKRKKTKAPKTKDKGQRTSKFSLTYKASLSSFVFGLLKTERSFTAIRLICLITLIIILVTLIVQQKSLGNALLTTGIFVLIVFASTKISGKNLFLGGLVVLAVGAVTYFSFEYAYNNVLQDYQRDRIESFAYPNVGNTLTTGWNREQATTAFGSGRLTGKGFLQGTHSNNGYLPFAETDFIFASFGEQFGFAGVLVLLSIYIALLIRILQIGARVEDDFGRLITYGVAALILLNMFQHMGMNIGILPITGVPLPLLSYGGSAVLTVFLGLGLVLSVNNVKTNRKGVVVDRTK